MAPLAWHYQDGTRAVGPVDEDSVRQRLRDGRMDGDTLVWCEGMPGWAPASGTRLADAIPPAMAPTSGPPDTGAGVSSQTAWLLACLPLGLALISALPGAGLIGLVAYVGLVLHDRSQIRQAGHAPSAAYWWVILLGALGTPVYLSLRARQLGDRSGYVVTSVLTLALFFALLLFAG